jgi:hypothetical protein
MKGRKKRSIPKPMSLCKVEKLPNGCDYPFVEGDTVLFLGEIVHMPGHCAVVCDGGLVRYAFHTDHFVPLTKEEL